MTLRDLDFVIAPFQKVKICVFVKKGEQFFWEKTKYWNRVNNLYRKVINISAVRDYLHIEVYED